MNRMNFKMLWMMGTLSLIFSGLFASATFAEEPKPDCQCTGNMTETYTKEEDYNGDGIIDVCTYTKKCDGGSRCEEKTVVIGDVISNGVDVGDITLTYDKVWGKEKFLSCQLGKQ